MPLITTLPIVLSFDSETRPIFTSTHPDGWHVITTEYNEPAEN